MLLDLKSIIKCISNWTFGMMEVAMPNLGSNTSFILWNCWMSKKDLYYSGVFLFQGLIYSYCTLIANKIFPDMCTHISYHDMQIIKDYQVKPFCCFISSNDFAERPMALSVLVFCEENSLVYGITNHLFKAIDTGSNFSRDKSILDVKRWATISLLVFLYSYIQVVKLAQGAWHDGQKHLPATQADRVWIQIRRKIFSAPIFSGTLPHELSPVVLCSSLITCHGGSKKRGIVVKSFQRHPWGETWS